MYSLPAVRRVGVYGVELNLMLQYADSLKLGSVYTCGEEQENPMFTVQLPCSPVLRKYRLPFKLVVWSLAFLGLGITDSQVIGAIDTETADIAFQCSTGPCPL